MKNYLEKYLKRELKTEEYNANKLPLMYDGLYEFSTIATEGFEWIAIKPKKAVKLADLKKHIRQLEKYTGKDCAYIFDEVSPYITNTLTEAGIPFVALDKCIYLPFAGMLISTSNSKTLKPVHEISFLTQKIVLTAIYEKWNAANVTAIAEKMGVTKTSVTRCMDEIEYLNLPIMSFNGNRRTISITEDTKVIWKKVRPFLRNPIIKTFNCSNGYGLEFKAGISALAEYSMLADNRYQTFGVLKRDIKALNIQEDYRHLVVREKNCEIQELGYMIEFNGNKIMDPLSIVLSLKNEDLADERIAIAVDEMLEEYVW